MHQTILYIKALNVVVPSPSNPYGRAAPACNTAQRNLYKGNNYNPKTEDTWKYSMNMY